MEEFDGVLCCTGHHVEPHVAHFEGEKEFKAKAIKFTPRNLQGKILHSHSYKDHVGFEDQRVVVVGVGNSGGDVAVELSRITKQVCSL